MGLAFMCCSIPWSFYNFMMPILLKEYLTELSVKTGLNTIIGLIMVLDNVIAILLLPIFGALSDRTRSKYGKRMPYIMIGCSVAIVAFSIVGIISKSRGLAVFIGLILVIMLFNFAMAFFRSSAVSLMPDLTDPERRSTGNAIINLMGAVSMVIGLAIPMITKAMFDTRWIAGENNTRAWGFYYVCIFTAISLIILILTIKETPTGDKFFQIGDRTITVDPISLEYIGEEDIKKKEPILKGLRDIFEEKEKSALFMLLVVGIWFFGYNAIDTFYSLYATSFLGWEEADASSALMVAPITMVITALFAGRIAEKIGRKKTIFIGLIGLSLMVLIMAFMKERLPITIAIAVIGVFYGMININTIVIVWQMAPEGKIGTYTGAYYLFSQLSATLSPVFAGFTFDVYDNITGHSGYILLFPYVIVFEILAMIFLSRVKRGETKKFSETEIKKLRDEFEEGD